ncbi:hypothetical protein [Methylobacterium sp. J-077]|uniref:hypothetical protein n=1 Tax=Methylobacterium sp. J-077 TaxID=2836656 RepID=UPI001FB8BA92|nr:hypothetical protein [Methylobacterium sp. J-077]MCJ2122081.1 hypothetical protein [Methylobacterium sp. J-077]
MSSYTLSELNHHKAREWCVRLDGAGAFIGGKQNTVIIRVDLLDLSDLFFKPDFREGTPHLTLYDGPEQAYANSLLRLLYRFDLTEIVFVSQLQKISPKAPTSGSFAIIYNDFYDTFHKYLACEPSTEFVRSLDTDRKLKTIEMILKQNFKELYDRLNTYPPSDQQLTLPFRNDEE